MHPHFASFFAQKKSKAAFTLIELLVVVAVVVVLTGITFGISKGVLNQQARARAKAELAMIAQALEAFKLVYGDYPVISEDNPVTTNANAKKLTLALTGFLYLEPGSTQGSRQMTPADNLKSFIDVDKMNFSEEFGTPLTYAQLNQDSFLVDPWRQPYVYVYNRGSGSNSWKNVGYVLFSKGPDRKADLVSIVTTGIVNQTTQNNLDNIYLDQ